MPLNKLVNKISRVFVLQLSLTDSGPGEELLQFGVHVFEVEASVRVPADVADVLEVGGQTDVLFLQLALLTLLAPLAEVAPGRLKMEKIRN